MPIQLTAPGGDVTVGRTTASYVYGSFTVRFPEGTTQQEADTRIQNAFIYRPDNRSTGRFDVSFVRADATVDLAANTSDFETILEAAQKRVEGDTFFEQDLLVFGRLRPGVDFKVGEIAHVSRWGKQIPAPITACDVVVDDQHHRGWRVHVGGQMVQDAAARKTSNDQILQQIAQERQQRLRQVGAVDAKATAAAAQLREALAGAGATDEDVRSQLADLNAQIQAHGEATDALPLIPAYIAANTARWQAQEEIDALQDQQALLTQQLAEANQRAIALLALQNHGALFIQSSYVLPAGPWVILDFSGVRGELRGCQTNTVSGSNGSGGGLKFLSPGDWHVRLRVNLPPGDAFTGTNTGIRITLMPTGGGNFLDRATSFSNNDGYDQTLTVDMTATIPESGCYIYAEAYASTASGKFSWWPADTGPELTELSARQLSYPELG